MFTMTDLYSFAKKLVLCCGEQLREKRRQHNFSIQEKTGHSDIVTDHDIWAQCYLCEQISKQYPEHSIVGEENMCREGTSCWKWVIDPIDGTTNYCQFGRDYAISVALLHNGNPMYGYVLDVENRRLYESGDSPQNHAPDDEETANEGILHIGFKTMRDFARQGSDPFALAEQFRGVRYLGCASLELCGIAEEQSGLYINSHLKLWDFAAAQAILLGRGCRIAAAALPDKSYFVCACRTEALYNQCLPFFPEEIRRKLNENGGNVFHVTNM